MADSPLRAQRKSCYLAEGIEETTALVAAERDHDLLVYYFIVVHQSAEPGREADVARGGTDRPTDYVVELTRGTLLPPFRTQY